MSRSASSHHRAAVSIAVLVSLSLTGCSLASNTSADTKRVSAAGISFRVPAGWEEVDPEDVTEGVEQENRMADLIEQSGLTPDQFRRMMSNIDLLLMSDERPQPGFVDNVGVLPIPGRMPSDRLLRRELTRGGGLDVLDVFHEQTQLGDATVVVYQQELADHRIHNEAVVAETADGLVSVTISASTRETADEIADGILNTLAETS
jgi:hypothetical protein